MRHIKNLKDGVKGNSNDAFNVGTWLEAYLYTDKVWLVCVPKLMLFLKFCLLIYTKKNSKRKHKEGGEGNKNIFFLDIFSLNGYLELILLPISIEVIGLPPTYILTQFR